MLESDGEVRVSTGNGDVGVQDQVSVATGACNHDSSGALEIANGEANGSLGNRCCFCKISNVC